MSPRIHHVQLMIERGREAEALAFYGELLDLSRIPKPSSMPNPEGLWFTLGSGELHLGVDASAPARSRAHVALVFDSLDGVLGRLADAGVETRSAHPIDGLRRAHVWDPFGNRLELMGE